MTLESDELWELDIDDAFDASLELEDCEKVCLIDWPKALLEALAEKA